jgi:adenosylmethionine-8-amino-7-oxononanoate aminotransferase
VGRDPALTFFHGHSFTANPLGCAAALASLDLLQKQPERFQQFEVRHTPLLQELACHPLVKRPRCVGTMAAFEVDARHGGYLDPVGKQIQSMALELGVYLRPLGNVVYLLPPLTITDSQLERCYAALLQALDRLGVL